MRLTQASTVLYRIGIGVLARSLNPQPLPFGAYTQTTTTLDLRLTRISSFVCFASRKHSTILTATYVGARSIAQFAANERRPVSGR